MRTGPGAALSTVVETLPNLIRLSGPSPRLPTATRILSPGPLQDRRGGIHYGDLDPGTPPQNAPLPFRLLHQVPLGPPQRVVDQARIEASTFRVDLWHLGVGADQHSARSEGPGDLRSELAGLSGRLSRRAAENRASSRQRELW
jgi:hypothetical protein